MSSSPPNAVPSKRKIDIDDLLAAVETVEALKSAMADQVKAIDAIWEQLDWLDNRITAIEPIS